MKPEGKGVLGEASVSEGVEGVVEGSGGTGGSGRKVDVDGKRQRLR